MTAADSALWADLDAALGRDTLPQSNDAISSEARVEQTGAVGARTLSNTRSIARFHDAVCAQLHSLWRFDSSIQWQFSEAGVAVDVAEPCDRCQTGVCQTRSFALRIFIIRVARESERLSIERMIARAHKTPHLYMPPEAIEYARRANLFAATNSALLAQPFILHACVDELCLLSPDARPAVRNIYNRLHSEQLNSPFLQKTIYFCMNHSRFHVCDQFCDQTHVGRHGERICALSSIIKSTGENVFTFGDGTARGFDTGGGDEGTIVGDMNTVTREDLDEAHDFGARDGSSGNGDKSSSGGGRRRTNYGDVTVLRERGSLRGRRRGRGRGSVLGGAERSQRERVALATAVSQSSGDVGAPAPEELARQFANAARNVANVPTSEAAVSQSDTSTSQQRKLRRAKRSKTIMNTAAAQAMLAVPISFLQSISDEQAQTDAVSSELPQGADRHDNLMNSRLAVPLGCAAWSKDTMLPSGSDGDAGGGYVMMSFNVRATIPFGERSSRFNNEFLFDVLQEKRDRSVRLRRFRLPPELATAQTGFVTNELFEQYGERACAIFWRIFASYERCAIEAAKEDAAQDKLRSAIDAYVGVRKRQREPALIEDYMRIARTTRDSAFIYKQLVIDDALWRIVETYNALLIVEFYFGLIAFVQKFSDCVDASVSETIQTHFFFEHFVPAILFFMRKGLDINGVVVLPPDSIIVHEWYPETASLKMLGVPEQTMTHLCSTLRSYIAAARTTNISMRRLEATQIDLQDLLALRLPTDSSPSPDDSVAFAEYAAQQVVLLFIKRRAARLELLGN